MSQYPQDPLDPSRDAPRDPYDTDPVSDAVASESAPYTTGGGASAVSTGTTTYPTETYGTETSKADQAKEQAAGVAGTAKEQAASVAGTAKDEAGNVAQEAKTQARNLVSEATSTLKDQAQSQTQQVGTFVGGLADQFQALTEGRTEEAGPIGQYAQQAGDQVRQFAQRIDERGFDGLVADVERFARRQPVTFLIGAAVTGFAVGRLLRGARDAATPDQSYSTGYTGTGPTYATTTTGYDTGVDYRPSTDYGTSPYETSTTGFSTAVGTGSVTETSLPVAGEDAALADDAFADTGTTADPVYGRGDYDAGDRR